MWFFFDVFAFNYNEYLYWDALIPYINVKYNSILTQLANLISIGIQC